MAGKYRWLALLAGCMALSCCVNSQNREQANREARAIFQQLVEINTTDSVGNVTTAAEAMAKRLRDAGFSEADVMVAGPSERKKNMEIGRASCRERV